MEKWAVIFALLLALAIGKIFISRTRTHRAKAIAERELGCTHASGTRVVAWSANAKGKYEKLIGSIVSGPHLGKDQIFYTIDAGGGTTYDKPVLRLDNTGRWVKTTIDITPAKVSFGA